MSDAAALRRRAGPIAVVVGCGVGYLALLASIGSDGAPLASDRAAQSAIRAWISPELVKWAASLSFLGSLPGILLSAWVVGILLAIARAWRGLAGLALTAAGGAALQSGLKALTNRPRPPGGLFEVTGSSFPSGHAMSAAAFWGFAVWLAWRSDLSRPVRLAVTLGLGLLIVAIGLTRLAINVHWLSDVLAGWCAGGAWAACCVLLVKESLRE